MIDRRLLLTSGLLVGAGVAARASRLHLAAPITPLNLERAVPRQVGAWRATPQAVSVLPDPDQQKTLAATYEEVVSRSYVTPDQRLMMLVIAHGRADSGLLAIHRAETCYSAQGFSVRDAGAATLPPPYSAVAGRRLFAVKDERQEPIVYWATVAGQRSSTNIEQKLRLLRAAWAGRPLDSFLIRASTIGDDTPASYALIEAFLAQMLERLPAAVRPMLTGDLTA